MTTGKLTALILMTFLWWMTGTSAPGNPQVDAPADRYAAAYHR